MHSSLAILRRYTDLPTDDHAARVLLDEVGLEVKRIDPSAEGTPFTLELLANRGDHHALVGIARELHGRTGAGLRAPQPALLPLGELSVPLSIDTDLCPTYTLTLFERAAEGAPSLDASVLEVLAAAQLESKGPMVDATNLVNHELGQPTHAFDADTIQGTVRVRLSVAGETALPLFAEERVTLPEGTLVIADYAKILAIAGVIGCEESKATDTTTRVLLESATFDPVAVRKAGTALGLHTDARARFERGADPALPRVAVARVAELVGPCGWSVTGGTAEATRGTLGAPTLALSPDLARQFLQVELSDAEIVERLSRYGFVHEGTEGDRLRIRVPSWRRWDVENTADLYEELAKSVGYAAIPQTLPAAVQGCTPTVAEAARWTAEEVLLGMGFYEVITDGFHGRGLQDKLGLPADHPLQQHVQTANALDRAYSLLKNSAFGQAVDGVATNVRLQQREVKAYEWTRTFHPDPTADNGVCRERKVLWAISAGHERPPRWAGAERPADVLFLKGLVEELGLALRLPLTLAPLGADHPMADLLHPGRCAAVTLEGTVVGVLGEVHPRVRDAFKLKKVRPCYLELDEAALQEPGPAQAFVEPPRVPPVSRNLAFTLPHKVAAGEVVAVLQANGPDWLRRVDIVDRFDHEVDGAPVRTITFALSYANDEGDRTAEEMNGTTEALIAAVEAQLGERGVVLR